MAGSYPDVPGYRFAYDVDGTVGGIYYQSGHTSTLLSSAQLRALNNDSTAVAFSCSTNSWGFIYFIFPELRDISGILVNLQGSTQLTSIQYSSDTTNGSDGSWQSTPMVSINTTDRLALKTGIQAVALNGVLGIRYAFSRGPAGGGSNNNAQIYGNISPTENPQRLRIVDTTATSTLGDGSTPTGSDIVAQLDFGNLKQRTSTTKQFKVVNNSMTQTASSITVSLEAPLDSSPSLIGQFQVSTDNVAFANAVNIGSLAPGAESGILYVRMNPASNAQLGPWAARIIAHPTSWS